MKPWAAAMVVVLILVVSALAFQRFWGHNLSCPPVRQLQLTAADENATAPWLELNDTDLEQNQILRAMFDAWYGNSSDPRVGGSKAHGGVSFSGSPADLQTWDEFLQSRGRAQHEVPIRYHGDSFLLQDRLIVC